VDLLGALHQALSSETGPDWLSDEDAFCRHFGVPYEDFAEVASCLDQGQRDLLDRTLEVNPEAAVLWVLHMEEVEH
jgi:hypothetical protein